MGTDGQSRGAEGRRRARRKGPGLALALLAALALSGPAGATHPSRFEELKLNIDGDRALEVVKVSYDVSSDHRLERGSVTATDRCGSRRATVALIPAGKFTPRVELRPAQLGRAGVGFVAGPRVARVARLRRCRLDVLLAFSSPRATKLELKARDDTARYAGREVVVVESLRDAQRRYFFRWAPARLRYVRYRTEISAA